MKYLNFLFSFFLLPGCVETGQIDLSGSEDRLIIRALLTDQPSRYCVEVKHSHAFGAMPDPATGALVILSDNTGNRDTLKEDIEGVNPGVFLTSGITAKPGRRYTLEVIWDGTIYSASSDFQTTPDLDSVRLRKVTDASQKGELFRILPALSFENQVGQYYMSTTAGSFISPFLPPDEGPEAFYYPYYFLESFSASEFFPVFSSMVLPERVSGYSPENLDGLYFYGGGDYWVVLRVQFFCISDEAYHFFTALNTQSENQGNVFSASPSTPPTMFSNGAVGVFIVTRIQEKILQEKLQ